MKFLYSLLHFNSFFFVYISVVIDDIRYDCTLTPASSATSFLVTCLYFFSAKKSPHLYIRVYIYIVYYDCYKCQTKHLTQVSLIQSSLHAIPRHIHILFFLHPFLLSLSQTAPGAVPRAKCSGNRCSCRCH